MKTLSLPTLMFVLTLSLMSHHAEASTISLDGEVDESSIARVLKKASELHARGDRNITLSLNSGGGLLTAALRAYPILKSLGVNTTAHGDCSSSCTVLFAAGRVRSASSNTTFEFHQVGIAKKNPFGKSISSEERERHRANFAGQWINAVRSASPSLAADLETRRVLLRGKKIYRTGELRRLGYIND